MDKPSSIKRWKKDTSPVNRIDAFAREDGKQDLNLFYDQAAAKYERLQINDQGDKNESWITRQQLDLALKQAYEDNIPADTRKDARLWEWDVQDTIALEERDALLDEDITQAIERGPRRIKLKYVDGEEAANAILASMKQLLAEQYPDTDNLTLTPEDGAYFITGFSGKSQLLYQQLVEFLRSKADELGIEDAKNDIFIDKIQRHEEIQLDFSHELTDRNSEQRKAYSARLEHVLKVINDPQEYLTDADAKEKYGDIPSINGDLVLTKRNGGDETQVDVLRIRGFKSEREREEIQRYLRDEPHEFNGKPIVSKGRVTPIIRMHGATSGEAVEDLLKQDELICGERNTDKDRPELDKSNPVAFIKSAVKLGLYMVETDAERSSARFYLIPNSINFFSGLYRGNMGEAGMGLFFWLSNIVPAFLGRPPRPTEDLVGDIRQFFSDGNGKMDFQKDDQPPQGRIKYGRMADGIMNWIDGDDKPGEPPKKPTNRFTYKSILNLMTGVSSFWGGVKGKKILLMDENLNPILGEDGMPQYVNKTDPALLASGVLVFSAYSIALVHSKASTGDPVIKADSLGPVKEAVEGIWNNSAVENFRKKNPAGKVVDKFVDGVQTDNYSWTGKLMMAHNGQQVLFGLKHLIKDRPQQLADYKLKLSKDAYRLFSEAGGEQSLLDYYVGENGLFPHLTRLVDEQGKLTAEAVAAKNAVIEDYEVLSGEYTGLKKKHIKDVKKNKAVEKPARMVELEAQMQQKDHAYDLALALGTMDFDDKSGRKGLPLVGKKEQGSYDKFIQRYVEKKQDPARAQELTGSWQEEIFKVSYSRKTYEGVVGSLFKTALRLTYAPLAMSAAFLISQINKIKARPLENTVALYSDEKKLYRSLAEMLSEDMEKNQDAYQEKGSADKAIMNLSKFISYQAEGYNLGEESKIADGIRGQLLELRLAQQEGEKQSVKAFIKDHKDNQQDSFDLHGKDITTPDFGNIVANKREAIRISEATGMSFSAA